MYSSQNEVLNTHGLQKSMFEFRAVEKRPATACGAISTNHYLVEASRLAFFIALTLMIG